MNSPSKNKPDNKTLVLLGWFSVALLILTLVAFASMRAWVTYATPPSELMFEARYFEHPIVMGIHMLSGVLFIGLAPLQFSKKIRTKYRRFHRGLGRFLLICALISGLYGLLSVFVLPVFGGLASATSSWFFGPLFLFSIARAFWCIRTRKIAAHREWMIRAFAIGLGVGSQRIILLLLSPLGGYGFEESFGPALWLGFGTNLLLAEFWIQRTRTVR